ncbi:DNA/RNA polymerase [Venturia nashicola]|nr:DNA/RNA polymerase [Venturia nashicola]
MLRRKDHRLLFHFDYDCFYASVFEAENPALKGLPLAVQQKQGLRKLQLIKEARRVCPEVIIVLGEGESSGTPILPMRTHPVQTSAASETPPRLSAPFSHPSRGTGRLTGLASTRRLPQVFMDVTSIVDFNEELVNENHLQNSFFCLKKDDPAVGFPFDASQIAGHVYGEEDEDQSRDPLLRRLILGSHLALYLRTQMEERLNHTCTVGISTSKLLSKLVGNLHKPQAQTTLLPPYVEENGRQSNVTAFIDNYDIGKIPNIGFKMAHKLREYLIHHHKNLLGEASVEEEYTAKITVRQVRTIPGMNPAMLDKILGGPGMPHGVGRRTWQLLHGVDDAEVGMARSIPQQISIEDSYIRLDSLDRVHQELLLLSKSLIRRMRADLTEDEDEEAESASSIHDSSKRQRWLALPKTLRLSTRPRPPADPDGTRARASQRISRSIPAPTLLTSLGESVEDLAQKLVSRFLTSLFHRLHPEKSGWDLSLINIAVTNIVETAGISTGRDISKMFKNQDNNLKEWKIEDVHVPPDQEMKDTSETESPLHLLQRSHGSEDQVSLSQASQASYYFQGGWDEEDEDAGESLDLTCPFCQAKMPSFAMAAHMRFHETED